MGPYSAPPNMIGRLEPESMVPAPANRTAPVPDDRTMSFPEITFDIFSFLDENQPGVDLLQSLLDAPPASVPAVVPPPAPVAAASQTSSGSQTVASRQQRTKLLTLRRLVTQLPRLPLSALPPGVTYEAATQVMLYYAVSQERSKIDGNILIHKLAKANNSAELARYTDLMIGFKHKTHLHTKNRHGETPLHVVTGPESARVLLERGAHLDARDMLGNTPIHLAARYQRVEVLAVLLEGTPEYSLLDMKNLEGYTALHLVVIHQPVADPHRRALQLLIDSGLDVNVADDTGGRSPLFHAVLRGDELAVRELVENNAAVNMADFSETTPLQAAEDVLPADNNHICSILLERGGFKVAPADRVTQTGRRGPRRKAV